MKIVYLITGSGGSFYCGNCYRDMIYLRAIRKVPGTSASAIPLYLPPEEGIKETGLDNNVFFGAISMYLREKVPFMRNMPAFMDKIFDSRPLLKMAAKRSGSTRTAGLEDMTLGMITGENAFPLKELQRLADHLCKDGKPDVIHLSNALILGLARQLKNLLDVKIVCSLLNEDDWINDMTEPYQSDAWKLIAGEAKYVDAFLTPSRYFRDLFIEKTGFKGNNIHVVPLALDHYGLTDLERKTSWPSIGYFCRMNSHNGFDRIVDGFIELKKRNTLPGLKLELSGGYTGDDKSFVNKQMKKIANAGYSDSVTIHPDFAGFGKRDFFSRIDVMCVPVRKYDGYGLYILEANAAAVPVVQPATGAFPEIIEKTGGGITYSPDTIQALADALEKILNDRQKLIDLGAKGRETVIQELTLEKMSEGLSKVYNSI